MTETWKARLELFFNTFIQLVWEILNTHEYTYLFPQPQNRGNPNR